MLVHYVCGSCNVCVCLCLWLLKCVRVFMPEVGCCVVLVVVFMLVVVEMCACVDASNCFTWLLHACAINACHKIAGLCCM